MKVLLILFLIVILDVFGETPTWDFTNSVIDLLAQSNPYSYEIDKRCGWYDSCDLLKKTIKKSGSTIEMKNHFTMYTENNGNPNEIKFEDDVDYESVESFYLNIDGQADTPLVCPRGNFNPIKLWKNEDNSYGHYQIPWFNNNWLNTKKDLKCYYHRAGAFLVYYLLNGQYYLLEARKDSEGNNYLLENSKYKFGNEFDEIYDFKLMNRDTKTGGSVWDTNYPFMALVKKNNYLQLVTAKYNFGYDNQYTFDNNKQLLQIKAHTRAYFNNFHYNNSFFFFTYNTVHDFQSGYSTVCVDNTKHADYTNLNNVQYKTNSTSPFDFTDEVEIEQMEIMYNNNFVYYKIRNTVTNKYYHGILDIKINRIVWNTDKTVKTFIPYIRTRSAGDQGTYEYADSMLVITEDSAYRVCAYNYNNDCVEECPSGTKIVIDTDGTKCVGSWESSCNNPKVTLVPEGICIKQAQCNTATYKLTYDQCILCRDLYNDKRYRFIGGTDCLDSNILSSEGVVLSDTKFYLLECDNGYQLENDNCVPHCYSTCLRCTYYSTNKNDQKCKSCIDGFYLDNDNNCQPVPTTIPTTIMTTIPTTIFTTIPTTIFTTIPTTIFTTIPTTIVTTIPTTIATTIPTTIITTVPTTIFTTIPTTIVTTIPTTIGTTIPTTIVTTIPTSIVTTILTTIITTVPTTIVTTIPTTIMTTIPTTLITTIPTTTITTFPTTTITTIPTTIITTIPITVVTTSVTTEPTTNIPTTIIEEKCKWGIEVNYTDSFANLKSGEIYEYEIQNIINSYCLKGSSVIVDGQEGKFQVTTSRKEYKEDNSDFTKLNLTDCENILKAHYNIDPNAELIILKYFKSDDKSVQYDLYNPFTHQKLNLSLCENTTVDMYIPIEMDEKTSELYLDLKDQGYEPLDLNDKFYREICTPYTSENGTDVLLDDREEFIYTSLVNATVCPSECDFSEFIVDKKYIKCECDTNTTGIETLDLEHLSGKNIGNSFISTLQTTNWKVMRCYNLVFNFKIFCHNYGSILILILFVVYLLFMIYFSIKDINPLKVQISKMLFEESEEEEEKETKIISKNIKLIKKMKNKNTEKIKGKAPPKKKSLKMFNKGEKVEEKYINTEDHALVNQKRKPVKKKSTQRTTLRRTSAIRNSFINKDELKKEEENKNKKFDNFELNNLDYPEACKYDKRSCCATYFSVLMREHLALLTFFACKDHNLFYVKIENFLILFCVDMTMSGLFFVHESMHRKYTQGEDFTFVQKLPQLLFTLIVAHILEVILCYFSMTDTNYYEIKGLNLKEKKKGDKIMNILSKMKRNLVTFFVISFILFLFFWYFISAFCAVYQNTQKIFLRDSMISFATSLIDPFFIYGITTLLRCISLSKLCKKNCCCGCLFKISDIIPIF